MQIGKVDVVATGKRTVREVLNDDVSGLAAQLAYHFFLALFPFFIFLTALGGFVTTLLDVRNPTASIMDPLGDILPADAASLLRRQLDRVIASSNPALLSFGIGAAIWAASGGVRATMKAMNRAYDVEETRPIWKKYPLSIVLTLLAGSAAIIAFILLVGGQLAGEMIAEAAGVEGLFAALVSLARWPLIAILLMAAMAFVYWAAPNIDLPFKWITPGAVLFTVVWVAATAVFGLYVANFSSHDATYGTLGSVVVLLLWFYLTGFIMLVGAELNAVVDEQLDAETFREQRRQVNEAAGDQHAEDQPADARPAGGSSPPTRQSPVWWSSRIRGGSAVAAFLAGCLIGGVVTRAVRCSRRPLRHER